MHIKKVKKQTKTSKRKKLIVTTSILGTVICSGFLTVGSLAASKTPAHSALLNSLPEAAPTTNALSLSSSNKTTNFFSTPANSLINALSPLSFSQSLNLNQINQQQSDVLAALNSLNLPFLQVQNQNTKPLNIVNYWLLNQTSFFTVSQLNLYFGALQVNNPNNITVQLNFINANNSIGHILIKPNQTTWIYNINGNVNSNSALPNTLIKQYEANKTYDVSSLNHYALFAITNLKSAYKQTTNNKTIQYNSPTIPVLSPLQIAQNVINKNGQNIASTDLLAMQNYLLKPSSTFKVNYQKYVAQIQFTALDISGISFSAAQFNASGTLIQPAQVHITSLTGTLKVDVLGLGINLTLNIKKTAQPIVYNMMPLLIYKQDNQVVSYPSCSGTNNNLSGLIFTQNANVSQYQTNEVFGYYLQAPSSNTNSKCLNLWNGDSKFDILPINFSYLFYNEWMLNHPLNGAHSTATSYNTVFSYGSIYDDGKVKLVQSAITPPKTWINCLSTTNQNIWTNNIVLNPNSTSFFNDFVAKNLNALQTNNASLTISINNYNYPYIYQNIVAQNVWLKPLLNNQNISFRFNVKISNENGVLTYALINMQLWNSSDTSSDFLNNTAIYYLPINTGSFNKPHLQYFAIYPTHPDLLYTTINLSNINLTFDLSSINNLANGINNNDVVSLPSSLKSKYLTANEAYSLLQTKNNSLDQILINSFNQAFNTKNNSQISFNDFVYSLDQNNNTIKITSWSITNNSNQVIKQEINNQNIILYAHQTKTITNCVIIINGFTNTYGLNSFSIDMQKTKYSNLLSNNFATQVDNSTNNNAHNNLMLQALTNLIFSQNSFLLNNIKIVGYTSNATNKISSGLVFDSLQLLNTSTQAYYLSTLTNQPVLLLPNQVINVKLTNYINLVDFVQQLSMTNNDVVNNYMQQCQNWINNLSVSELQNDFVQMQQVQTFSTSMPSQATMNYSNFAINVQNYNQKTNIVTLSKFTWNIAVVADVAVIGNFTTNVNVALNNISFKIVPVLYYLNQNNQVCSYPSVVAAGSDPTTFSGVVTKDVVVSTTLDYTNMPIASQMSDIRFGYFIEPTNQAITSDFGNGFAVKLSGKGTQYKPYLNLSYAFNNFVMLNHYQNNKIIALNAKQNVYPYGSLVNATITPLKNTTVTLNPYASVDLALNNNLNLNNVISSQNISLIQYINNLLNDNYLTNLSKQILNNNNNNTSLTINSLSYLNNNEIDGITISNNSNITYKLVEDVNNVLSAYFILPFANKQVINFANNDDLNVHVSSNLFNENINYNLQDLWNKNNAGALSYYSATKYLADGYAYLYPMLWTQDNYNCLKYDVLSATYSWNEGTGANNTYTITNKTWKAYITDSDQPVIYLNWIGQILGLSANISNTLFDGYKVYVVTNNSNNNEIVISGMELNNVWYNTNYLLNGGTYFYLS